MNVNFLRGFDNSNLDLGRMLWALGVLAYVALFAVHSWRTGSFDPINFALGFGIIHGVGAGGAGVKDYLVARAWVKKRSAR